MSDPTFPALHVRPAAGWLNDPNGLCRIDGTWHVFFQYNPDAPVHGDIAWGHLSSTDLLHWREHPVALRPRAGEVDAAGCWSGCVVDDAGTPTAVYTAVATDAASGVAVLARSDRSLDRWVQDTAPVAGILADQGSTEVRDPFVLEVDGRRYVVQGAGSQEGPARLLAYDATDLTRWRPIGELLTVADPVAAGAAPAHIWECPNLVEVDGRWVLLVSRWAWNGNQHELSGCTWFVGDLAASADALVFTPRRGGRLDDGPAFYAPQVAAADGRVLLFGWSWELGRGDDDVRRAGWAGTLTHPRELHVVDDRLHVVPAAELEALRAESLDPTAPITASAFELVADGPVRLDLVDGEGALEVWAGHGPVRVLVDGSIVEVFAGGATYTTRAYPTDTSHWQVEGADRVWAHRLP